MLTTSRAFSGFSVDDMKKAVEFYQETLGLNAEKTPMGLHLTFPGGGQVFVYQKDDHQAATYTVLNFPVEDIDAAVKELKDKGVKFIKYEGMTDESDIARGIKMKMGPDIAWFKDPAGNFLAVLHNE